MAQFIAAALEQLDFALDLVLHRDAKVKLASWRSWERKCVNSLTWMKVSEIHGQSFDRVGKFAEIEGVNSK
ncbi:hypothetical protein [Arenibacterium sp. LLYu02]|uniref:hypothetical protein n=1 Tax=Arenibacterium sp. LLYu02 TaxID=3404132 RepID=UPI003B21A3B5